jgi:hypothetical protein
MTISVRQPDAGDVAGILRDALGALTDSDALGALDDGDLLVAARYAEELGRLADAARILAAGEIAERSRAGRGSDGLASRLGCRNAAELLERAMLISGATARLRLATASHLRATVSLSGETLPGGFPRVRGALAGGFLPIDAAVAITRELGTVLDRGADPNAVDAAEAELVAAAVTGEWDGEGDDAFDCDAAACAEPARDASRPASIPATPDEVRVMAQTWALVLDPDGSLPDEEKGRRRRGLLLGRLRDGVVPLHGHLLPDVAAQLQRLLDAYLNPRVEGSELQGPVFTDSEDLKEDHEHRSSTQKRHDALAGILAVAAGHAQTPTLGGAAPTLVVAVTDDQLAKADGVAFVQGIEGDRSPIPASVARHTGCAGAVQRIVQRPDGKILTLGVAQRIFTGHQRRAIGIRDGECVIPGCHVPATWCEVHHVHEAARGGSTHTDNGVLLCWFHHRTIERSGWIIEMRDGLPWVRPPGWIDPHRRWQAVRSPMQRWRQRATGAGRGG